METDGLMGGWGLDKETEREREEVRGRRAYNMVYVQQLDRTVGYPDLRSPIFPCT